MTENRTPRMHGAVYDAIIGQTSTPRADEKVLRYLERIAPSEPMEPVVVWSDDEEPADPRFHMFAPEHKRKDHLQNAQADNQEILEVLANSEVSYPHEGAKKGSARKSTPVADDRQNGQLENFGSRGWTPLAKPLPLSPAPQIISMPGVHSRTQSRQQSRAPSRPSSTRPVHRAPVAPEIDIKPPSTSPFPNDEVRSLAPTDPDVRAARVASPPMRSPHAMYTSPPNIRPTSGPRSASAFGPSGGAPLRSPVSPRHKRRSQTPPLNAAAFAAPWWERTQYGPHNPPEVVGTMRLKAISPDAPREGAQTPKAGSQIRTPKGNATDIAAGVMQHGVIEALPADEHVHGHVHEITELEPDVVLERSSLHGDDVDEDDIAHYSQENYDLVDDNTATPKRAGSESQGGLELVLPKDLDVESLGERQLVDLLRTPATGFTNQILIDDKRLNHHHDEDLCILLQAADDEQQHPVVRKAVKKAIASRLLKLGMGDDYDNVKGDPALNAALRKHAFGKSGSMVAQKLPPDAPEWARLLSDRIQDLTDQVKAAQLDGSRKRGKARRGDETTDGEERTPRHYHVPTEGTGFEGESLHPREAVDEEGHPETEADQDEDEEGRLHVRKPRGGEISPGEAFYDEEIYKLRKTNAPSPRSHATWEIQEDAAPPGSALPPDEVPEIPDSEFYRDGGKALHRRQNSSQLDASQPGAEDALVTRGEDPDWFTRFGMDPNEPPPWLKVNQRLLNWAIVWPLAEFDGALKSCERGEQIDEVALSIWTTQVYKRYVRSVLTQYPPGKVDKMFVPPNIADAINNAAYNGRHGDAAMMLQDLWKPFGFVTPPKIILVLARHRREENHWVVHRFSLPDASIITYDTYMEKALPDGRPLGWWFGIRIAFPSEAYPPPDQVIQRMIRLHRPMQLLIDNSVAAGGIWRNLLMGSKADRLVDLDRLRDLIRQEVKSLRQKKEMGKLSLSKGGPWEMGH